MRIRIRAKDRCNQSSVNIGIMQPNTYGHSSRNVRLYNAYESPQYFARAQIL
jgi:hypothetical protein